MQKSLNHSTTNEFRKRLIKSKRTIFEGKKTTLQTSSNDFVGVDEKKWE